MILNFLSRNVLGTLEDNVELLTFPEMFKLFSHNFVNMAGFPYGSNYSVSNTSEPVFWLVYNLFASNFNTIVVYNLLIIISLIVIFLVFNWFYRFILSNRVIAFFMAALVTLSPYVFYKSSNHPALLQIWLLGLCIYIVLRTKNIRDFVLLGLTLAFTTLVSNYLGFFSLLFSFIYFSIYIPLNTIITKKLPKTTIYGAFITFFICGFVLFFSIRVYIQGNFLEKRIVPVENVSVIRPIEDFFIFSSRPWYYFIPSVDNPFFGQHTQSFLNWLDQDLNFWLGKNYFKSEHSIGYLGWVNFAFSLIGFFYIVRQVMDKKSRWSMEASVLTLGLTALALFFFTMPPYITLGGYKFFFPSYVLYHFFPMFRVLARLGIMILIIQLIFTGFGYLYVFHRLEKMRVSRLPVYILLASLFMVSLMEFYVPFTITRIEASPEVFVFISENTPETSVLAVFPYSKTHESLFWMRVHRRSFVNPRGYKSFKNDFNAETFTKNLTTCNGIIEALSLGITHLVYFPIAVDHAAEDVAKIFADNPMLTQVGVFSNYDTPNIPDARYINYKSVGNFEDSSAILYEVRILDKLACPL